MTGADMLAYLDWSGLRPMSELEYEKACRTPSRVIPGEYAWNTTSAVSLGGQGGLSTSTIGTENESPVNNNANVNSEAPSFGPVRCGSFGTSNTNQEQSGGTESSCIITTIPISHYIKITIRRNASITMILVIACGRRDSTVTFRGGRSLRHVIDAGEIGSDATCPGLVTINSIQNAKTYGDSSYVKAYWEPSR